MKKLILLSLVVLSSSAFGMEKNNKQQKTTENSAPKETVFKKNLLECTECFKVTLGVVILFSGKLAKKYIPGTPSSDLFKQKEN